MKIYLEKSLRCLYGLLMNMGFNKLMRLLKISQFKIFIKRKFRPTIIDIKYRKKMSWQNVGDYTQFVQVEKGKLEEEGIIQ